MNFEHEKKQCLEKKDRSQKQSIDREIKSLLNLINSLEDYYTTSSCSGRILLIEKPSRKKIESKWIYTTHQFADLKSIKKALKEMSDAPVWLHFEPFIIHICCRSIDSANLMLSIIGEAGLKHSGLISISKRIIIESMGNDIMQCLVAEDNRLLVDDDYLNKMIEHANQKQKHNHKNINKLERLLKEKLAR